MEADEINFVMEHLRRLSEPNTALIITQNEEGEIIDARVVDVTQALFLLEHGVRGEKKEEKPEASGSLWWSPQSESESGP
jgi:hypothetical protein